MKAHRVLEVGALVAVVALFAIAIARIGPGVESWGWLAVAVGVGYLLADLMTGLVHWAGDTVGSETWPVVGKNFIGPFRQHHVDPKDLTRHDFVELNGNNAIIACGPLAVAAYFAPDAPLVCAAAVSTFFFALVTNQLHQWAHADAPPRVVRALQRARVILSPEHHQLHHTRPYASAYCITTGWMNPVLDRIRFFRAAERVIAWVNPELISAERRRDTPLPSSRS